MKIEEIKAEVESEHYDFLRNDPHLRDKIILLALGGSYAYGTNIETSDIDIRGCALNRKSDLIGLSCFEQVIDSKTDTTIYGFNKLIRLLMNCNPNIIEMLGCKPEHYLYITEIGKQLLDNRKMFLSQKAADTFGGYALHQLRKLQNALKSNYSTCPKDSARINKHAMHLIRLYLMCFDILEREEICTYRENDRDFLLSIRSGAFRNEDNTFKAEFFELVSEYEKRLKYARENTSLPAKLDIDRVEEFMMSVNEYVIRSQH